MVQAITEVGGNRRSKTEGIASEPDRQFDILARMPRFYLHVCNGHGFAEDHDGQELATITDAREAAIRGAREVMASDVRQGELDLTSFIEVEDENRRLLFTVTFADAIQLKHEHGPAPSAGTRKRSQG